MKHYIRGHFTVTFDRADGVTPSVVTALLTQLKPGAVIDDMTVDRQTPLHEGRRLVIAYREPAEKGA